jgi:DNA polymerase-3 subunit delta
MNLNKPAEAQRFLAGPPADARACVIYGRDRSGVRERADGLARRIVPDLNDPFAVGLIGEGESDDLARIADELSAMSLIGGPRLVRLQLAERAPAERAAAEALKAHLAGGLQPRRFLADRGRRARQGLRRAPRGGGVQDSRLHTRVRG